MLTNEKPDLGESMCRDEPMFPWYAIKVRTGWEPVALSGLVARGFEPFLPAYEECRRYSDRIRKVNKAAFPGYLFCRLHMGTKTALLGTPAVSYVVSCAGVPLPVPDEEIEGIRKGLEVGGTPVPYLTEGQRVRIHCGALTGVEGVLTRIDGETRLTVSVHLLQRSVAIRVKREQVVPI